MVTSSAPLDGINDEVERPDKMIMTTETSPAINNGWRALVVSVLEAERKIRLWAVDRTASIRQPAQMIRGTTPARITEVDESENEACPTVNTAFAFADPDDWTTG
jgi:hypothetical protein